jgi:hypothetical protein
MGQLSNVRRIVVEDFPEESRETVGKLASILNNHMEEVVELSRGNISYENLNQTVIKFEVTVDAQGKPTTLTQINTGLSTYSGKAITDVQGVNSASDVVTACPYLDCTYQGNGLVRVNRVLGLPANKKMRVTVEFKG